MHVPLHQPRNDRVSRDIYVLRCRALPRGHRTHRIYTIASYQNVRGEGGGSTAVPYFAAIQKH